MNILVTGASGFLGGRLITELDRGLGNIYGVSSCGTETTVGCDLNNKDGVKALIESVEPDCIIHCAAYVPKKASDYQDDLCAKSNVLMTQNILDASFCPIIYISSMTVYGDSKNCPIAETEICRPANHYAQSKLDCERLIKESGCGGFAMRIPGLFGWPRQSGLVFSLIRSALTGEDIDLPHVPISWSGIHVADAAQGIVRLIPKATEIFSAVNLGCPGESSVNNLIRLVNDIYGSSIKSKVKHPPFEFDLSRYQTLTGVPVASLRRCLEKLGDEIDV